MSQVLPSRLDPPNCSGLAIYMYEGLEDMLQGKKVEIPKGILAAANRLLQLAHTSFYNEGFAVHGPESNELVRNLVALEMITKAYSRAARDQLASKGCTDLLVKQENVVRNLIYLTQSIPLIHKLPPQPVEEYRRLSAFYKELYNLSTSNQETHTMTGKYPHEFRTGNILVDVLSGL